jgi:non-ribosomal peptide synthetase component F
MPTERSFGPRGSAPFLCLPRLLEHHARRIPDAPAILAPGRAPLTYGRLSQHMDNVESMLRATGIGRRDQVAVVLSNGPEMAVAVLTVAALR